MDVLTLCMNSFFPKLAETLNGFFFSMQILEEIAFEVQNIQVLPLERFSAFLASCLACFYE